MFVFDKREPERRTVGHSMQRTDLIFLKIFFKQTLVTPLLWLCQKNLI